MTTLLNESSFAGQSNLSQPNRFEGLLAGRALEGVRDLTPWVSPVSVVREATADDMERAVLFNTLFATPPIARGRLDTRAYHGGVSVPTLLRNGTRSVAERVAKYYRLESLNVVVVLDIEIRRGRPRDIKVTVQSVEYEGGEGDVSPAALKHQLREDLVEGLKRVRWPHETFEIKGPLSLRVS